MAKGERSKIAERMQRGKRQRAREGKIVRAGRPPLGFVYAGHSYRVDEPTMILVRRIFSLAAGGESLWRINKTFESEGIVTSGSTYKGPSRQQVLGAIGVRILQVRLQTRGAGYSQAWPQLPVLRLLPVRARWVRERQVDACGQVRARGLLGSA